VPHLYRVHSSSGAVEYRLVDVVACLCSCPNNGLMCSHRYAVVVAKPQYSIRFGLVLMVRRRRLCHPPVLPVPSLLGCPSRCDRRLNQGCNAGTRCGTEAQPCEYYNQQNPHVVTAPVGSARAAGLWQTGQTNVAHRKPAGCGAGLEYVQVRIRKRIRKGSTLWSSRELQCSTGRIEHTGCPPTGERLHMYTPTAV